MTTKASIIYARVSTAIQDTDRQVIDLQAYANGNDYSVERIFTEKISGAKKNSERPALMDALEYATKHKCTILCSEMPRSTNVPSSVANCRAWGVTSMRF